MNRHLCRVPPRLGRRGRCQCRPQYPYARDVDARLAPTPADDGRIPITAIIGTGGKTAATRLISHIPRQAGLSAGTIEIDTHVILRGHHSGAAAAQAVLREPMVEHEVVEVAGGGIMRHGLRFDECDVSILLNIASDRMGQRAIHPLEQLARCKTTFVDAVMQDGD